MRSFRLDTENIFDVLSPNHYPSINTHRLALPPPAPIPCHPPLVFFLAVPQEILSEYLSLFSFTGMALDEALR